jgi:hypothetical protein
VMDSILTPVFFVSHMLGMSLVVTVSHMLRDSLSVDVIPMTHCVER